MPDSRERFKNNAELFAKHLSSLITRTLPVDRTLLCKTIYDDKEERWNALIQLRPQTVTFENGYGIRILHRVIPNPDNDRKVMTANYSYAYGFGTLLEDGWLMRYEYDPEQLIKDPSYEYSVAHVHFNGESEGYEPTATPEAKPLHKLHFPTRRIFFEDFIEHLIVEMGVMPRKSKKAALEILDDSRKGGSKRQTRHK